MYIIEDKNEPSISMMASETKIGQSVIKTDFDGSLLSGVVIGNEDGSVLVKHDETGIILSVGSTEKVTLLWWFYRNVWLELKL